MRNKDMIEGNDFYPDRSKFKDSMHRYRTQSLFLEYEYNEGPAVYTLDGADKEYNGTVYPSLRRLYLELGDPTEYEFANRYLHDWDHWMKICNNAQLMEQIEEWREELEVKIRSQAIRKMLSLDSNFNAIKWAADGHWNTRGAGRPKKAVDKQKEAAIRERAVKEAQDDSSRILPFVTKKKEA